MSRQSEIMKLPVAGELSSTAEGHLDVIFFRRDEQISKLVGLAARDERSYEGINQEP